MRLADLGDAVPVGECDLLAAPEEFRNTDGISAEAEQGLLQPIHDEHDD